MSSSVKFVFFYSATFSSSHRVKNWNLSWSESFPFFGTSPLTTNVSYHRETSQSICHANQLTGFHMMGNTGRWWVKGCSFLAMDLQAIFQGAKTKKVLYSIFINKKKFYILQEHQNFEVTSKNKKFQFQISSRLTYQRL